MTKFITLLVVIFSLGPVTSLAQPDPIDTDRPDQTESPSVVPKKWMQLEFGLSAQQNTGSEKEYSLPTLLSRYGISKKIELRLVTTIGIANSSQVPTGSITTSGLVPVELGTKLSLWEEKKWIPKTSLLCHVLIPRFASKIFYLDKPAPGFTIAMQNTLTKKLGLGYNIGAEWDGYSNKPAWLYTFSPGFNIGEKWYAFIEVYGSFTKDELPQHNLDYGLAYLVNNNIKVDISSGVGLSDDSPRGFISIGGSFRFKAGN